MASVGLSLPIPGLNVGGGMSLPGFSSSATSSAGNGATFVGPGQGGSWNVNVAGSGPSSQGTGNALLWVAIAVAAVWLLKGR